MQRKNVASCISLELEYENLTLILPFNPWVGLPHGSFLLPWPLLHSVMPSILKLSLCRQSSNPIWVARALQCKMAALAKFLLHNRRRSAFGSWRATKAIEIQWGGEGKNKFYKTLQTLAVLRVMLSKDKDDEEETNSSASVDKKYQKVSVAKCEKNEAKQGWGGMGGNCVDDDIVTVYVAFTFTLLCHVFYDCSWFVFH